MRKSTIDIIGGCLFLGFGIAMIVIIPHYADMEDYTTALSPGSFPNLVAWITVALSCLLLANGVYKRKKEPVPARSDANGDTPPRSSDGYYKEVWAGVVLVVMFLYYLLLPKVGHLVAAPAATFLILAIFRVKKWYYYVTVLAFSFVIYLLFSRFLHVPLP